MPFFSRVFRSKDSNAAKKAAKPPSLEESSAPPKPTWTDAWQRMDVAPEEVQDLLRGCTQELKARALQTPFLLLPFRPSSDPSAARSFIRHYFTQSFERGAPLSGDELVRELRLTDPMVLCSVMKWCWSRLPGGVVTWEAYELFKVGEQDSQFARDAFSTFIPISVDSDARAKIIFDFFDLLAAIAAHGKTNGLGGRKLSRFAGWWAFEHTDMGHGFEAAYKSWANAADATSHLFFAYLRSLSPDTSRGMNTIATLPIALQSLVQATEYPPETPTLLQVSTTKVVMIVDTVSPTPFALLRRAKNFEYRDSDRHLQEFSNFDDPLRALTDECLRVLRCIASSPDQSNAAEGHSTREESWSKFEDMGFGSTLDSELDTNTQSAPKREFGNGMKSAPQSGGDLGRPTTPSWADFMSTGFSDETVLKAPVAPLLLPPDKVLPPIDTVRGQSSQSHKRNLDDEPSIDPGELASITTLDIDDSFWWVWISSLAGEESTTRKAVFGRCALLETIIKDAKWLVLEEQVKGAAPEPEPGAYIAEKKRFFGFSSRRRIGRRKSSAKKASAVEESYKRADNHAPTSKTSIAPDQHKRIQAAAAALQRKHQEQEEDFSRGDGPEQAAPGAKTNSVLTLQPSIIGEASHAMKWASNYDKNTYRTAYLSDNRAGTGAPSDSLKEPPRNHGKDQASPSASMTALPPAPSPAAEQPPSEPQAPPTPPKDEKKKRVSDEKKDTSSTTAPLEPVITEPQPKQSSESGTTGDDGHRKLKKKPGSAGFKSMFGTTKKKDPEQKPPMKPTGGEKSAVAAARAAYEEKEKAKKELPQPQRPPTNGQSVLKKKPVPGSSPAGSKPSTPVAEPTPAVPETQTQTPTPEKIEPEPEPQPQPQPQQIIQPATPPREISTPREISPVAEEQEPSPVTESAPQRDYPRTGREAEFDALSRVDTNERAAADQEFSRFDQGPLVEQPAFAPEDDEAQVSDAETLGEQPEQEAEPAHQPEPEPEPRPSAAGKTGSASAAEPEPEPEPRPSTTTSQTNPSQDRWAQIRRNAAERAAQVEHPRYSTTDDGGNTSEEEDFETRAARIKARVAELTGNMKTPK